MRTLLFGCLMILSGILIGQKHDANWLFGYGGWSGDPNFGDVSINFWFYVDYCG